MSLIVFRHYAECSICIAMLREVIQNAVMLSVIAPKHKNKNGIKHNDTKRFRPYAEHGAFILMSRVFLLNVVMLNVVVPHGGKQPYSKLLD